MIDSVFRIGKNYYAQVFLEECKFVVKVKKMTEYITDDINFFWFWSEDSDEEFSNEKNADEKVFDSIEWKYRMCLVYIFKAFWLILGYS